MIVDTNGQTDFKWVILEIEKVLENDKTEAKTKVKIILTILREQDVIRE